MIAWVLAFSPPRLPDPGLLAWRTPDSRGRACSSCHSPDGIELASYAFGESDVVRRAAAHLPKPLKDRILEFILTQRKALPKQPLDPMVDRPLQPGGSPLRGETATERDIEFLRSIPRCVPALADGKIDSLAKANKACEQIVALDLSQVQIGIPLNRLSEDGFHGSEHASLANWIPDVAVASSTETLAAQSAYLARPTQESLAAIDAAVLRTFHPRNAIETLALAKYRALLEMQHGLRQWATRTTPEPQSVRRDNPYWQIAEMGRTYAGADPQLFALPSDIATAKASGPSLSDQMRALRLPWYWLGWIRDPILAHSGGLRETMRADYFVQSLLRDGPYVVHAAFMLFRKLSQQAASGRPWEIQFSFLLLDRPLTAWEPVNRADQLLFRHVVGNILRAALWRLENDIAKRGSAIYPESQALQVRMIDRYLSAIGEPESQLVATILARIGKARRID